MHFKPALLAALWPCNQVFTCKSANVQVQRTREVQRAARRRAGKPVVAVVGYTNAGKSSLLQALTHTDAGVQDRSAFSLCQH